MRKLMMELKVGLLVVGLLAMVATPAMAQFSDPLTLATSGVLLPFFGTGNNVSFLERAAPVNQIPDLHMVFYNASCVRGEDRPIPLTTNYVDVELLAAVSALAPVNGANGLVAIANLVAPAVTLSPLDATLGQALHTRVYWFDVNQGLFRVLEPITLLDFERTLAQSATWNPIRTGITFFAPNQQTAAPTPVTTLRTSLIFICPRNTIQGVGGITEAFPAPAFPAIGGGGFKGGTSPLTGFVYDDEEHPLASINTTCDCLTGPTAISTLSTIYIQQNSDTYTELVTDGTFAGFTGYKALFHTSLPDLFFGRLSNGFRGSILNPAATGGTSSR